MLISIPLIRDLPILEYFPETGAMIAIFCGQICSSKFSLISIFLLSIKYSFTSFITLLFTVSLLFTELLYVQDEVNILMLIIRIYL